MPIILSIFLVIGAFFIGSFSTRTNIDSNKTRSETKLPTSSPIPTPSLMFPSSFPTPTSDIYKRQLVFDLIERIGAKYVDLKKLTLEANNSDKLFTECINKAEQDCLKYSQPFTVDLGDGPIGPTFYSPTEQVQLCNKAKSVCSVYLTSYNAQTNSITTVMNDIGELKKELLQISKDCSSCTENYQTAMKKFDEFDLYIKSLIK